MFHVSHDVERAFLLELGMSFHIEAAFLRAADSINQCIGGACDYLNIDALTVLDMDGGTAVNRRCVGQCKAVQFNSGFVGT